MEFCRASQETESSTPNCRQSQLIFLLQKTKNKKEFVEQHLPIMKYSLNSNLVAKGFTQRPKCVPNLYPAAFHNHFRITNLFRSLYNK